MAKALSDFAVGNSPVVEIATTPPAPRVCKQELVLAFDQSIANTGWALVEGRSVHPVVIYTGMIMTDEMVKAKTEDRFLRASAAYIKVKAAILDGAGPDRVLHEGPMFGGVGARSTESSVIMATAVRIAALEAGVPCTMIPVQTIKLHILGKRSAKKAEIAAAMRQRFSTLQARKPGPLNEHTYDAIAVAVTYLEGQ